MMQDAEMHSLDLGFITATEKFDKIRNENFRDTFSEWYGILNDGGINDRPWNRQEIIRSSS